MSAVQLFVLKQSCDCFLLLLQICSTLTLPFDVVKTHRQVELGSSISKLCSLHALVLRGPNGPQRCWGKARHPPQRLRKGWGN